jgi:hypothetical protein
MAARAITGWGGSLTIGGTAIPVRNVTITRQASEFNLTAHGDAKQFAGPGRVKRGGSCEAYVSSAVETAVAGIIDTPNLASPASLVFTPSTGGTAITMSVIITGADQTHSSEDAAIYSLTFTETLTLA